MCISSQISLVLCLLYHPAELLKYEAFFQQRHHSVTPQAAGDLTCHKPYSATCRAAAPFWYPVDAEDAPEHHNVIQRPMDLSTILDKLEAAAGTFVMLSL